jgi:Flp pilus assembly protein TadD
MKKFFVCLVVASLALATFGCQSNKKKTPSDEAQARWKSARAAVLSSLAKSQLEAGSFEKARQTIEEAERLDPKNAELRIIHAKLALEEGRLEVADVQLAEARRLAPKNAEADYLSGVVYQRWLKPQTAYDYYTSAAEKGRTEVAYPMAQAEMLIQLAQPEQALSLLQGRLEDFGTSAILHDTIGQLHVGKGEYPQAVAALRQAHTLASDDLLILEHLALAQFYNRDYREAAQHFSRVMRDPKNTKRAELLVALGECQLHLGQTRDARDNFASATEISPQAPSAWLSLAKATLQTNEVRRAEAALRKAMALSPENAEAHLMLGYLKLRQDKFADALSSFRKANALDPNDPVSLCMIGYVLERSGRPQQAVQFYGRALQIKPDDELATKLMASVDTGE